MDNQYSNKDIIQFFLYYAGAVVSVYLLPNSISFLYFGILLILFWRSDKNALWFLLIYFMIDPPGGLFPEDFNYGLPFIKGVNLRFIEIFVFVAFLKAVKQKNKFQIIYYKQYQLLLLLTVILLIYTLFLNFSLLSIIISVKWIFIWSLLYSIPKLINSFEEWLFLFRVSFVIVFIATSAQIIQLALGYMPSYLLGTNFSPIMDYGFGDFVFKKMNVLEYDVTEARPVSCISIIQLALIGAMFFLQFKKKLFPNIYLYLIILVSYLSIILTATRGWFIAFSVVLLLFFIFIHKLKRFATMGIVTLILIPLLLSVPIIEKQFIGAFKRLSTVQEIVKGDLSAGGTSSRDEYSKDLINLWSEKPFLGWGFSDFYKSNGNGHAGLANLLFGVGIIGFLVFLYFWYKLVYIPFSINSRISNINPYKKALLVFILGFLVFFILNATSGQQFGIYLGFGAGVMSQILFYSYSSFFIISAIEAEQAVKTKVLK